MRHRPPLLLPSSRRHRGGGTPIRLLFFLAATTRASAAALLFAEPPPRTSRSTSRHSLVAAVPGCFRAVAAPTTTSWQRRQRRRRNKRRDDRSLPFPRLAGALGDGGESSSEKVAAKPKAAKSAKAKGVYARPSAAIERGSGFYVPGLEGPKVRLAVGAALTSLAGADLALFGGGGAGGSNNSAGNAFSEGLALALGAFVLLQGAIEYAREARKEGAAAAGGVGLVVEGPSSSSSAGASAPSSSSLYQKRWRSSSSASSSSSWRDRVEWAALSYLSLTPATHLILVDDDVLFSVGKTTVPLPPKDGDDDTADVREACLSAIGTAARSRGGRVALPPTHPASLRLADPDFRRTVVLQRITDNADSGSHDDAGRPRGLCWIVTSNELLAAFTQQDLQWLGQLAAYVRPPPP